MRSITHNGVWDLKTECGKKNLAAEHKMMITAIALTGMFLTVIMMKTMDMRMSLIMTF